MTLWYNHTTAGIGFDLRVDYRQALEEAFIRHLADEQGAAPTNVKLSMKYSQYPIIESVFADSQTVVQQYGAIFFFASIMFSFMSSLNSVVQEKELKLRETLRMQGGGDFVFWFTWFWSAGLIQLLVVVNLIFFGWAFRFDFFVNCDLSVLVLVHGLFAICMTQLAFLVSTLVQKVRSANTAGFIVFLAGIIVQFIFSGDAMYFFYLPQAEAEGSDRFRFWRRTAFYRALIQLWPPLVYTKCFSDISSLADSRFNFLSGVVVEGDGYKFADLSGGEYQERGEFWDPTDNSPDYGGSTIPPTSQALWRFVGLSILFRAITFYLDNVIERDSGTTRPWYFLFTKTYWLPGATRAKDGEVATSFEGMDSDVVAEQKFVESGAYDAEHSLTIVNLRRTFTSDIFRRKDKEFVAVDNFCLSVGPRGGDKSKGTLLGLLGHNGAGKSTTISIVTGMLGATSGDAFVMGHSVRDEMDVVRTLIGVCPQHDILWDKLTAMEHLRMFARLRNLETEAAEEEAFKLLKAVNLYEVRNDVSASFSGGMKRRLSSILALVGNPKVVFLDEPSTGLDPESRHILWELFRDIKQDRIVVMTTHSMEEADALSDRIAIMAAGRLIALGTSVHIKQKYGTSYRITVTVAASEARRLKAEFATKLPPTANLVGESAGALLWTVEQSDKAAIAPFFRWLEDTYGADDKQAVDVKDWSVSLGTLEECFLALTSHEGFSGGAQEDDGEDDKPSAPVEKEMDAISVATQKPAE